MNLSRLRKDARAIFEAGIEAVNPVYAVNRHFRRKSDTLEVSNKIYRLSNYEKIYIIGAGKASAAMAQPVEDMLGDLISGGVINVKYGHALPLRLVKVIEAGHPVPDEAGLRGTKQMIQLLKKTGERDLVICLISGGGSALLPLPAEGLTLGEKQQVTKLLLECGATIQEMNAVRKHISQVKGGQLARLAYPSTLVSLILSDVIGDNLDSIASGPTAPDPTTFNDCLSILERYNIKKKLPPSVFTLLEKGARGEVEETPKPGDPVFERTQNVIVGSNLIAVEAARKKAGFLGYSTHVLSTQIQGEAREAAISHAILARKIIASEQPVSRPAAVISGGETTVTLRGKGLGGRNQEFALAAAIGIAGLENVVVLSGGTDGTDGLTDAAGAVADGTTLKRAQTLGLDPKKYLDENDSFHFFQALGDLLITGPTYTNVMDLQLVIVG